ncbi:MAG: hypothetical protein QM786_11445 [Breznakibacter sp.]
MNRFFKSIGKIFNGEEKDVPREPVKKESEVGVGGEVNAAIALSLYLYRNQLHDHENAVLTINKVARAYSPWSSKIYGLRRWPRA